MTRPCPPIQARPRLDPLGWIGLLSIIVCIAMCGCGSQGPSCVTACAAVPHHAPMAPADLPACVEACAMASCVVGCDGPARAR